MVLCTSQSHQVVSTPGMHYWPHQTPDCCQPPGSASTEWPMVPGARDFPLLSPELASNWSLARILASHWLMAVTLTRPLD